MDLLYGHGDEHSFFISLKELNSILGVVEDGSRFGERVRIKD
jgi:hypothetical protein